MRSVSKTWHTSSGLLLLATSLSGCVTTQQLSARAQLRAERELAAGTAVHVSRLNPSVRVAGIALVRGRGDEAFVVRLRNLSARPLTDLPISVGVTSSAGHEVYLNSSSDADYFESHVASVGAGRDVTWVLTSRHPIEVGARPFAKVGFAGLPPSTTVTSLPQIEASSARLDVARAHPTLTVGISNLSSVPQYALQVYAVAMRGSRVLAAGRGALAHLGTAARAVIDLALTGNPGGAKLAVGSLPTIFK